MESIFILPRVRTNIQACLFFSTIASFINSVGYLLEMTAGTEEKYIMALKMSYLGRVWVSFSLFLFVLKLTNVKYSKILTYFLAGIHVFTYVLIVLFEKINLYYTGYKYIEDSIFPFVKFEHGIWYKFYSLLLVVYIIVGITLLIINFRNEKDKLLRRRLFCIIASIVVQSAFYFFELLNFGKGYDLTMPGYGLGSLIICIGLFKYDILSALDIAKDYVIEDISEAVIIINMLGKLEYANERARSVFDLKNDFEEVIKSLDVAIDNTGTITATDRIFTIEKKTIVHDGAERGCVYVLEDDTELYKYNEALKEQKDIAEAAKEEALSASASKSAFISVVSHEIRTPMNAVVGMTELLLREKESLTDKQEKYLRNIKNSGAALVMIVNDILDQSKIEAGKMEIVEDDYELRPMVEDVKLIIENRIGSKPIRLIVDIDDAVPRFLIGDSLRIRQILINLMNNAVKFTEEGYIHIIIECVQRDDDRIAIKFSIKDSGQGIKEEDLEKLGNAFTQVDSKKNHSKEGTGLGLSISKDFISMMGGQLEVTSIYGEGSTFFFTIWQGISTGIEVTNASGICKQAWQDQEEFTCKNAKILIVDDTEINLMIAAEIMEPLGATIDVVQSGKEAIEKVKENTYHIILMDYMMPFMDGVETTAKIRELSLDCASRNEDEKAYYFKNVPIITLSGDSSDSTKDKFLRAGIDDFMEKPIDLANVKKKLLKWLPHELIDNV